MRVYLDDKQTRVRNVKIGVCVLIKLFVLYSRGTTTNCDGSPRSMGASICCMCLPTTSGGQTSFSTISKALFCPLASLLFFFSLSHLSSQMLLVIFYLLILTSQTHSKSTPHPPKPCSICFCSLILLFFRLSYCSNKEVV